MTTFRSESVQQAKLEREPNIEVNELYWSKGRPTGKITYSQGAMFRAPET